MHLCIDFSLQNHYPNGWRNVSSKNSIFFFKIKKNFNMELVLSKKDIIIELIP